MLGLACLHRVVLMNATQLQSLLMLPLTFYYFFYFFCMSPQLCIHIKIHIFSFQGSLLGCLLVLCMLVYNMVLLYVCIETIMIF